VEELILHHIYRRGRDGFFSAVDGPVAVDPQTGRKLGALPTRQVLSNGSAGIAVVGKQLWTTYGDIHKLQRIVLR
jgi:hypothetical protein